LLTYGLVSRISGKSNLDLKMKLLERFLKELEDINVKYVSKPFWIATELALIVNGLDRILYLSGDYIAITKAKLREIKNTMESMKTPIAQQLIKLEGLSTITAIVLSIIGMVNYIIIPLLLSVLFIVVTSMILKSKSQNAERLIKELEEYTKDEEKDS
jgi:preprotein translocase subunit Sss1